MHKVLSTGPVSREQTREIVARAARPHPRSRTTDR